MKIGISGTHGVGKTTLANALAEKLGLPLISEQARVAAREMGFNSVSDIISQPNNVIYTFQRRILELQKQEEQRYESFISDRTTLDMASYLALYTGDISTSMYDSYYRECIQHAIGNYDVILYVPIEFSLTNDGFRSTCTTCQKIHNQLICKFLRENIRNINTVLGTVEERVTQALAII